LNGSNIIDSDEKPTARTAVEGRALPMAVPGVSPVFNRSPIWKIFDFHCLMFEIELFFDQKVFN
jgi:hypothetical protein